MPKMAISNLLPKMAIYFMIADFGNGNLIKIAVFGNIRKIWCDFPTHLTSIIGLLPLMAIILSFDSSIVISAYELVYRPFLVNSNDKFLAENGNSC